VKPRLQRGHNNFGKGLSVEVIVAIGLYKLAHGQSYVPIMNQFGVGKSTAQKVCVEFNRAVWKMRKRFIGWKDKKATRAAFAKKGFPGCLGAIDGCHIPIKMPKGVGQAYKNYKGFNSIVLSGVVDENRRFCSVDIGSPGVNHDSHTYKTSPFFKYASGNFGESRNFDARVIDRDGVEHRVPPYVIGDPAYPLSRWLMKGWPGSKCNQGKEFAYFTYRLSSARMKVEQAYGILKGRWKQLQVPHHGKIKHHCEAIGAACVLHNICIDEMKDKVRVDDQPVMLNDEVELGELPAIRQATHGGYSIDDEDVIRGPGFIHARTEREAGERTRNLLTELLMEDPRYQSWRYTEL
jgi:hypothetical protein